MVSNLSPGGSSNAEPGPGPGAGSDKKKPAAGAAPTKQNKKAGAAAKREVKILMLHGYTQSGPLFHAKTRALEKLLIKSLTPFALSPTLIYPTAPNQLFPAEIPGYVAPPPPTTDSTPDDSSSATEDPRASDAWAWFRRDAATGTLRHVDASMRHLAATLRESGPVDGCLGFSQGGAMAARLAAALEASSHHPDSHPDHHRPSDDDAAALKAANGGKPLKFLVVYSGFHAPGLLDLTTSTSIGGREAEVAAGPPLVTPALHFIGSLDTVVEESRSRALVERCVEPVVVEHPGGHYVPISKEWAMPLIGFVKDRIMKADAAAVEDDDDKVQASSAEP